MHKEWRQLSVSDWVLERLPRNCNRNTWLRLTQIPENTENQKLQVCQSDKRHSCNRRTCHPNNGTPLQPIIQSVSVGFGRTISFWVSNNLTGSGICVSHALCKKSLRYLRFTKREGWVSKTITQRDSERGQSLSGIAIATVNQISCSSQLALCSVSL